jgi:ABC-type transporter Mla subunit MlaD
MSIDASILKDKASWRESGMSLDELRKQLVFKEEEGQQAEYRLSLASKFRDLNEQLIKQEDEITAAQTHASKLKSPAAIQKVQEKIKLMEQERDQLKGLIKETKTLFELDNKHGTLTMKTVQTRIHNLKSQAAQSRMDQAKTGLVLAEKEGQKTKELAIENRRLGGYMAYMGDEQFKMLGGLGDSVVKTKEWYKSIELIPKSFVLFDLLLKKGLERFIALDKAAEDFRKITGFSINQMKELRKDAEAVNSEFAGMGVSIEAAYKSAKALTDVFGRTSLVSKEALKNTALLSANLGVAEESTANVLANFQGLGGATQEAAMNVVKVGAGISEKAGVPFKLVMQDVANASETTLNMLGANPSKLMKSAIAARAMGMELNKMVESQRKMLDFSSSINDELNASALLGKNINFQLARQYAFEGRIEDSARATLETVKRAGDFNKMNVYQREALAKASGMELKDLTKMMAVDAQREAIMNGTDETKKSILRAQEAELKALKEKEKLDSEDLVKQNEKVLMQQKMQGIMTNINNLLDAMKLAFAEVLEPVITPLAKILVPLLKVAAFILKGLLLPLKGIGWLLSKAAEFLEGMVSGMGEFGDTMKTLFTWALGIGSGLMMILFVGKAGWAGLWSGISSTFAMLGNGFTALFKKQTWSNLWNGFTDGASAAWKSVKSIWNKESASGGGIGESLKSGFGKLKDKFGFGKSATSEMRGLPTPPTTGPTDVTKTTVEAAKSSDGIKQKSGEGLKDFLENLAAGLKAMKGADVLLGALNLIPASLGLVVMIPGFFGAKLLERLDGEKVKAGLEGLSAGIKSMASADVLLGAGALMLASLALVVMVPGLIGMAGIALLGTPFSAGLVAMSAGLAALGGNPIAWLGIAAIGALSLAFIGFAFGIKLISEGLSTVVSSFTVFADLDWSTIAKGLSTMLGLGVVAAALGLALPLIIGGAFAIGVLGVAMIGFGKAIEIARPGLESLGALLDRFAEIGADGLLKTAFGITALSGALAAFGAGSAAAGLGSFAGKLLGGDPIKRLQRFIDIGPKLKESAESIDMIASATSKFGMIDAFATAVDRLVYSLEKLNDQLDKTSTIKVATLSAITAMTQKNTETPTSTTTETAGGGLEGKMDELIRLLRDGAISIDLDGERVSRAMAARGRE